METITIYKRHSSTGSVLQFVIEIHVDLPVSVVCTRVSLDRSVVLRNPHGLTACVVEPLTLPKTRRICGIAHSPNTLGILQSATSMRNAASLVLHIVLIRLAARRGNSHKGRRLAVLHIVLLRLAPCRGDGQEGPPRLQCCT